MNLTNTEPLHFLCLNCWENGIRTELKITFRRENRFDAICPKCNSTFENRTVDIYPILFTFHWDKLSRLCPYAEEQLNVCSSPHNSSHQCSGSFVNFESCKFKKPMMWGKMDGK